jgi:hypothetical protein
MTKASSTTCSQTAAADPFDEAGSRPPPEHPQGARRGREQRITRAAVGFDGEPDASGDRARLDRARGVRQPEGQPVAPAALRELPGLAAPRPGCQAPVAGTSYALPAGVCTSGDAAGAVVPDGSTDSRAAAADDDPRRRPRSRFRYGFLMRARSAASRACISSPRVAVQAALREREEITSARRSFGGGGSSEVRPRTCSGRCRGDVWPYARRFRRGADDSVTAALPPGAPGSARRPVGERGGC